MRAPLKTWKNKGFGGHALERSIAQEFLKGVHDRSRLSARSRAHGQVVRLVARDDAPFFEIGDEVAATSWCDFLLRMFESRNVRGSAGRVRARAAACSG
jgi:hypothetical protein